LNHGKIITVPGNIVNLQTVLSVGADGINPSLLKKELQRFSSNITKEAGEFIYQVSEIKVKYKPAA
jgi:hypothetical protein